MPPPSTEQDTDAESWPPAPHRPVTITNYGRVTVRREPDSVELAWRNPRRRTLWSASVAYALAIGCLLYQLIGNPAGSTILQLLAGLQSVPDVCLGVTIGTLAFVACAVGEWRSIRTVERTRIYDGSGHFIDGLGRQRPLSDIIQITIDRQGMGYQVRMWPQRRGVSGFLRAYHWFPVWNVGNKEAAEELAQVVGAAAGLPVVWR